LRLLLDFVPAAAGKPCRISIIYYYAPFANFRGFLKKLQVLFRYDLVNIFVILGHLDKAFPEIKVYNKIK